MILYYTTPHLYFQIENKNDVNECPVGTFPKFEFAALNEAMSMMRNLEGFLHDRFAIKSIIYADLLP